MLQLKSKYSNKRETVREQQTLNSEPSMIEFVKSDI